MELIIRLISKITDQKEMLLSFGEFKSGYSVQATLISYPQTQHGYTLGAQVIAKNKQNTPQDFHFSGKEGSWTFLC